VNGATGVMWQAVVNVIAAGEVGNDTPRVSESIWRARV
jgi:hypothetical protein